MGLLYFGSGQALSHPISRLIQISEVWMSRSVQLAEPMFQVPASCFLAVLLRQPHQDRYKPIIGKHETALFIWGICVHSDWLKAKFHSVSRLRLDGVGIVARSVSSPTDRILLIQERQADLSA